MVKKGYWLEKEESGRFISWGALLFVLLILVFGLITTYVVDVWGSGPRTLSFAGYNWIVKGSNFPTSPGPNYFSDREEDVWVDSNGIHLTISQRNGRWFSTEVILNQSLGYGKYVFQTRGRFDIIDPNMVAALFTWDNDYPVYNYREIDIEFARWGDPDDATNAQYVVHPGYYVKHYHRFRIDLTTQNNDMTHYMIWIPGSITFKTYRGQHLNSTPPESDLIEEWAHSSTDVPPPGNENVHFNFWLYNGNAPTNNHGNEFVVTGFTWNPL